MSIKRAQNGNKRIRCEYCNSTFKTKANMKRHLKKYCKNVGNYNNPTFDNKIKNIEDVLYIQQKNMKRKEIFI